MSDVYKSANPDLDPLDPEVESAAVRAGARALFCQAVVNIICAICLPFVVGESGVTPGGDHDGYAALNGNGNGEGPPGSAVWKKHQAEMSGQGGWKKALNWVQDLVTSAKRGEKLLPLKGLTLMRLWWVAQAVFAICMAASW